MKAITFILLSVLSSPSLAEAIKYKYDIRPNHYNDVWEKQIETTTRLDYDPKKDSFDFYIKETLYLTGFTISREQADLLIESIEKYKKWNLKASKKGVTLEKKISTVPTSDTFWKIGNGDWDFGLGADLTMHFFSLSTQKHQLVILFPKFQSKYNQYSDHRPEALYFDYGEAMKFKKSLSRESVLKFASKAKKQAEISAEFN